jgi:hypothetical protein
MKFKEIACQVTYKLFFQTISSFKTGLCEDVYVGKISTFLSNQDDFLRLPVNERPEDIRCLIMILESPHIEEYKVNPAEPVKGTTGRNIREYILSVNGLSGYNNYGLIIVNAIQYQCSLGQSTKYFRDDMFKSMWKDGGENSFIQRLIGLYKTDDVIVNCCTKGGGTGKNELRKIVQAAITTNLRFNPLKRTHPSSWNIKKQRNTIWM